MLALPRPLPGASSREAIAISRRGDGAWARADQLVLHYTDALPRGRVVQLEGNAEPGATLLFHEPSSRVGALAEIGGRARSLVRDRRRGGDGRARCADRRRVSRAHADAGRAVCAHALRRCISVALRHARRPRVVSRARRSGPVSTPAPRSIAISPRRSFTSCVTSRRREPRSRRCISTSASAAGSACTCIPSSRIPPPIATTRSTPRRGSRKSARRSRARSASRRACARTPAIEPWTTALPPAFVATAARLGREDWRARRTQHLLSDTLAPAPWVALALSPPRLACRSARPRSRRWPRCRCCRSPTRCRPTDDFDRAIVADGLRAMCIVNARVGGSFAVRSAVPDAPIAVDAHACRVTTARRGDVRHDRLPAYWLPPASRGLPSSRTASPRPRCTSTTSPGRFRPPPPRCVPQRHRPPARDSRLSPRRRSAWRRMIPHGARLPRESAIARAGTHAVARVLPSRGVVARRRSRRRVARLLGAVRAARSRRDRRAHRRVRAGSRRAALEDAARPTPRVRCAIAAGARRSGSRSSACGPHATIVPAEPLARGFRYVIRGEAEDSLVELADAITINWPDRAAACESIGVGLSWLDRGTGPPQPDARLCLME